MTGSSPAAPTTADFRRNLARKIVIATLLGAIVFAGLSVYSDVQKLQASLSRFHFAAFGWALVLAAGNYGLRIVRWEYYLRRLGIRIPPGESSLIFLSGFIMSVTPGKIGEVFKSLLLYESRGIAIARTAPIVVAERLTDLLALVALTALGSLSFHHGLPVALAGTGVVALALGICAYRPLAEWVIRALGRVPLLSRFAPKLAEAYEALRSLVHPTALFATTLISLCAWGLECAGLYLILQGFPGVHLGWQAATFAYSASTIVGALAMMPGGLGVTEIGMTGLLQALGGGAVTAAVATASTMLVRLATLWFAVAIGMVALGWWRLRHATAT